MAGFPIKEDEIINGDLISYIYPQHERADGGFVVTGEKNPLPVANYTQNEVGLWLPTSKENPMPTQVTGSKVELVKRFDYVTEGTANAYFGEDTRTGPGPGNDLNISSYRKISIAVKNDTDKELNVHSIYFRIRNAERSMEKNARFGIDLPVGSETTLNGLEHSDLKNIAYLDSNVYPYMRLRTVNNDGLGKGTIKVAILGVR